MDRQGIQDIFEAYFQKYKKTEGDESAWSCFWTTIRSGGNLDINMTKCPRGQVFKFFKNNKKFKEVVGWEAFFDELDRLKQEEPDLFDEEEFFKGMEEMT
ncbi:MAG: hypothetical protein JW718_10015 [Desulfovibrionaceae bacterium]|nr:hypothetical protein [Desulfovibrionaceae bacterium]